jgi:hypothetical protein
MDYHINFDGPEHSAAEKRADYEAIDDGTYEHTEEDFDKPHVLMYLWGEHGLRNGELAELYDVTLGFMNAVLRWHGILYPDLPPGKVTGASKPW